MRLLLSHIPFPYFLVFLSISLDFFGIDVGYTGAFKAVSGEIFEFGFPDAMLQMTAAYLHELTHGRPLRPSAGCVTPEETALSHRLFTAALRSHEHGTTEKV